MSKGKDFRPRKRGFDDDEGPMSYEARSHRPPPRSPFGGGFAAEPGGIPSAPVANTVDATVKWFKSDKGFGFVELGNGAGDAFLHIGALQSAGYETVPTGAKMKVLVTQGMKGAQVSRVVEVDTSTAVEAPPRRSFDGGPSGGPGGGPRGPRRAPDMSSAVDVSGKVKWFDEAKGFGFVASDDGGKDVFIHISILRPANIQQLAEGQAVIMKVVDTPKGREAVSIALG
jgi:CspA family cold shock protein